MAGGNFRATATLDASGFVTGVQRVKREAQGLERSFQGIARDVREASAALRAGQISQRDYAQAVRFAQQEVRELGNLGVRPTTRDLSSLNTIMRANADSATRARAGLGTLRSGMSTLAAQAVGVRGTIGQVSGALLQFSAGNAAALAVVAGIGGIAAAFRLMGKEAREAREQAEALFRQGAGQFGSAISGARAQQSFDAAVTGRDALRSRRDAILASQGEPNLAAGLRNPIIAEQLQNLGQQLILANQAVEGFRRALTEASLQVKKPPAPVSVEQALKLGQLGPQPVAPIGGTTGLRFDAPTRVTQAPFIGTEFDGAFDPRKDPKLKALPDAARSFSEAAVVAISSFNKLVNSLVNGSQSFEQSATQTFGNLFSAFLSGISPVLGMVSQGLFNLLGSSSSNNRPLPVHIVKDDTNQGTAIIQFEDGTLERVVVRTLENVSQRDIIVRGA